MKKVAWLMIGLLAVIGSGCAQKSASEKLQDDLNRAGKKLNSDMKEFSK